MDKNKSSSPSVIVLIMNFLQWEKKKNEPDLPAPSPALNTISLLNLGLREACKDATSKLGNVFLKTEA